MLRVSQRIATVANSMAVPDELYTHTPKRTHFFCRLEEMSSNVVAYDIA